MGAAPTIAFRSANASEVRGDEREKAWNAASAEPVNELGAR